MISEIRKAENEKLVAAELRARGGRCFFCGQPVFQPVWHQVRGEQHRDICHLVRTGGSTALARALGLFEPAHIACASGHSASKG